MLAHVAASNRKWCGTTIARIDLLTTYEKVSVSLSQYLVSYPSSVYAGITSENIQGFPETPTVYNFETLATVK